MADDAHYDFHGELYTGVGVQDHEEAYAGINRFNGCMDDWETAVLLQVGSEELNYYYRGRPWF